MTKSLQAYAKENPPSRGKVCWVCELPQREEIDECLRNGMMQTTVREWLINEHGMDRSVCKITGLNYHISKDHHVAKKPA